MSVLHAPRRPEVDRRLFWFPALIIPGLLMLVLRLWYVQVNMGPQIRDEAQLKRRTSLKKLAPRGTIFDRRGTLLAGVEVRFVVTIKPSIARKHPEVVEKVAKILQMPLSEVEEKIERERWRDFPAPIKVGVGIQTATQIAETPDLIGVSIDEKPMRVYQDTRHYSHLMGYVWTPTKDDIDRLKTKEIEPAEYIGKSGLEKTYEADLMGIPGQELIDKRGKSSVKSEELATPGKQLYLTLDAKLQAFSQELLQSKNFRGAIVALDPRTGEILTLVSNPSFDTKLFDGGISVADYKQLNDPKGPKPMLNRAIASAYEPGSTYKIVTSIAAYRAGKLSPNTFHFCPGGYDYGGGKRLKCLGTHGSIGYLNAMARSCNTYFCNLGIRAGKKMMVQTALDMGLGTETGIELPGETSGIVPTDEWLEKRERKWYVGNLGNMSVGQGDINASPLQMANVAAMVANNGVQYRPHLVRAKRDPLTGEIEKVQPQILNRIEAEPWLWDQIRNGLTSVISSGTAQVAQIPNVSWGGKTGSAEHGRKGANLTHGWFVGFAPKANPTIAICVMAESAGHGGDVAAPIARDVVSYWLSNASKASSNAAAASRIASISIPRS